MRDEFPRRKGTPGPAPAAPEGAVPAGEAIAGAVRKWLPDRRAAAADKLKNMWETSRERGIELFFDCRLGRIQVLRAARVYRVPMLPLRRRTTEELSADTDDPCWNDIIATTFDDARNFVQSFAFAPVGTRYVDWLTKNGALAGGPRHLRPDEMDLRIVRLPMPAPADWLLFHQAQAPEVRGAICEHQPLALFYTGVADPPPQRPELPFGRVQIPVQPLPWATPEDAFHAAGALPPLFPGLPDDFQTDDGEIISLETYIDYGDPETHFDIVITGDGYQNTEQQQQAFYERAKTLIDGLVKMQPFKSVQKLINWYIVKVGSKDSGITGCSDLEPRTTFYQLEGCWDNSTVPGFMWAGDTGLRRIWWAAQKAVPNDGPHLVIVIGNCSSYGGHGLPGGKLVIVPSCESAKKQEFVGMVAHECAHAMLSLAEEYISVDAEDPTRPDYNKAHLKEVIGSVHRRFVERRLGVRASVPLLAADTVWWKGLAKPDELHKDGTFCAVHVPGDDRKSLTSLEPDVTPDSDQDFLGAFWGCQDLNAVAGLKADYSDAIGNDPGDSATKKDVDKFLSTKVSDDELFWWDPKSAGYFRSAAVCRMRFPTYEFCRVCQHLIRNAIKDVCGEPPDPPFPPTSHP